MSSATNHVIKETVSRFQAAWMTGERPWIADYLESVDPAIKVSLMTELIPIDIAFRKQRGEKPRPGDYLQLGADAVGIAFQDLHESFAEVDTGKDFEATLDDQLSEKMQSKAVNAKSKPPMSGAQDSLTTGFSGTPPAMGSIEDSASDFIGLDFDGQDGPGVEALRLLQDLLVFHLDRDDPAAHGLRRSERAHRT